MKTNKQNEIIKKNENNETERTKEKNQMKNSKQDKRIRNKKWELNERDWTNERIRKNGIERKTELELSEWREI